MSARAAFHRPAELVDQLVVWPAGQEKVVQVGPAAVHPVPHVVALQPAPAAAAGELADAVSAPEQTHQPGRDRASSTADADRAPLALGHQLEAAVASQPAGDVEADGCALLQLGAAVSAG